MHSQSQSPAAPNEDDEAIAHDANDEFQELLDRPAFHKSPSRRECAVVPRRPNAHVAAVGRSLLDRPKPKSAATLQSRADLPERRRRVPDQIATLTRAAKDSRSTMFTDKSSTLFTASSANAPVIRRVGTTGTLISCLTSSSSRCKMSSSSRSINQKNQEFKPAGRNVSFSHLQVREYEVTLGDNPSVSSGVPVSLGWRYNPQEKFSSLRDKDMGDRAIPRGRSMGELRLSNRERQPRLLRHCGSEISIQDMNDALRATEEAQHERRESHHELKNERAQEEERQVTRERRQMRQRRTGIVDGGVSIGESILSYTSRAHTVG